MRSNNYKLIFTVRTSFTSESGLKLIELIDEVTKKIYVKRGVNSLYGALEIKGDFYFSELYFLDYFQDKFFHVFTILIQSRTFKSDFRSY